MAILLIPIDISHFFNNQSHSEVSFLSSSLIDALCFNLDKSQRCELSVINEAHAVLVNVSTSVKSKTFMKTKPGKSSSFYLLSAEIEGKN